MLTTACNQLMYLGYDVCPAIIRLAEINLHPPHTLNLFTFANIFIPRPVGRHSFLTQNKYVRMIDYLLVEYLGFFFEGL